MKNFQDVKHLIHTNKSNHEKGYYNCIPFEVIPKLETLVPGILRGNQYILTGSSGCAKSKLTRFLFLHCPYNYVKNHPELEIKLDINYFSLEESREKIYLSELSRLLKTKYGLSVSVNQLRSIGRTNTIPKYVSVPINKVMTQVSTYAIIDECEEEINTFMNSIKIYGKEEANPTGIYFKARDLAYKIGKYYHRNGVPFTDAEMMEIKSKGETSLLHTDIGGYKTHNDRHYVLNIVDNINLLKVEKGLTKYECIGKLSNDYFLTTKNRFLQTNIIVSQQTADKEQLEFTSRGVSIEEKLEPSKDGIAENKSIFNDAEFCFGIFNPARYGIKEHNGMDILKLSDNYRSLSIMKNRDDFEGHKIRLFFDGACDYFRQMPDDPETIKEVYKYAKQLKEQRKKLNDE
jgi:hypothetical protein